MTGPEPAATPDEGRGRSGPRRWKGFELSEFQREAIAGIRAGHDVLVSAPTGAGKTLVAEYAIFDAVNRGRRCIYTAPIKALSNQKYRDFRDDPRIDVGLMTGDVTIHPGAQVLIMTTEILRNSIFENPALLADVEFVIFDEVHFMDDLERGTVWEESLIFSPASIRFICLSATISNLDQFAAWLGEVREHRVVSILSRRRPVPLSFQLFTRQSKGFDPTELKAVRAREGELTQRRGKKGHGRGSRRRPARGNRGRRPSPNEDPTRPPDPSPLFDRLTEEGLMPALVFAFSRKDCERLARQAASRELLDSGQTEQMRALQAELVALFQLEESIAEGEIFRMARRGVGYHHAGMLPAHKEVVERFFTSGLIKLLFTTETFALGINMPARTVVFNSLRKFDGVNFDYMRTRDFLQMAGRAGRQGIDEEGLVYTLLSDKDLREAPLKRLLAGEPEPVNSRFRLSYASLLHLVEHLGRARVHEAWEKSFNRFQHRDESRKRRERNSRMQHRQIDAQLDFLADLGYLEGDELRPRGLMARSINGYELQTTELLFRGVLENLTPEELAVVFVGIIHEERRHFQPISIPGRLFGPLRRKVDRVVRELGGRSYHFDIPVPPKLPEWGLTPAVVGWMEGEALEDLRPAVPATPGDLIRPFRMSVQLMRQVKRAIDPEWDLHELLDIAMSAMNRDEVDARRQLELG
jgi:superfamily II RNA helicase